MQRERQRERHRERETNRDTERDRDTDRHSERQRPGQEGDTMHNSTMLNRKRIYVYCVYIYIYTHYICETILNHGGPPQIHNVWETLLHIFILAHEIGRASCRERV